MAGNLPTKKQRELLSFIDGFIKGNGYAPSYREIMRSLDYKSVSTVSSHVDSLIVKGYLRKVDNSARTLEVCTPGQATTSLKPSNLEQSLCREIDTRLRDSSVAAEDIEVLVASLRVLGFDEQHVTYRAKLGRHTEGDLS